MVELYLHYPICLYGIVLNLLTTGATLLLPRFLKQSFPFGFSGQIICGFIIISMSAACLVSVILLEINTKLKDLEHMNF
jgi:hypothetical protein